MTYPLWYFSHKPLKIFGKALPNSISPVLTKPLPYVFLSSFPLCCKFLGKLISTNPLISIMLVYLYSLNELIAFCLFRITTAEKLTIYRLQISMKFYLSNAITTTEKFGCFRKNSFSSEVFLKHFICY